MKQFPTITTDRLFLRQFKKSDSQAVFNIFSQDIVTKYYILDTMKKIEQAKKLVASNIGLYGKKAGIRWAIVMKGKQDSVIGSAGFGSPNRKFHSIEIGYSLHPDYWGKGIMTEALAAIFEHSFSQDFFMHLNRIEALVELGNKASTALLKKLGFQEEGIRREHGFWKGRYNDMRSFSLLRRDWIIQHP